jgi:hypothetical protein
VSARQIDVSSRYWAFRGSDRGTVDALGAALMSIVPMAIAAGDDLQDVIERAEEIDGESRVYDTETESWLVWYDRDWVTEAEACERDRRAESEVQW